jgi:hypothetical protein
VQWDFVGSFLAGQTMNVWLVWVHGLHHNNVDR